MYIYIHVYLVDAHEKLPGENNSQSGLLDMQIHMHTWTYTYKDISVFILNTFIEKNVQNTPKLPTVAPSA